MVLNGWASWAEANEMYLEQLAELCEHADKIADAQEHARQNLIPRAD